MVLKYCIDFRERGYIFCKVCVVNERQENVSVTGPHLGGGGGFSLGSAILHWVPKPPPCMQHVSIYIIAPPPPPPAPNTPIESGGSYARSPPP